MPPLFILAKMIARSYVTKWRFRHGRTLATFGSTHHERPVESSLNYIQSCYDDYITYGQIDASEDLAGAEILEGGPGDNFGVGALFLAAGAARYVGVDPFYSEQDIGQQRRIYQALRERLPENQRARFDQTIDLSSGVRFDPQRLQPVYGKGVGDFAELFAPASFDYIISRAVLEQVHDIEAAFRGMDRVLKPGGRLLHKIDLSDYGIFSGKGFHPLTQLTFSDSIYGLLASNTGNLNRFALADYRGLMEQMGYSATLYATGVIRSGYPQRELKPHPVKLRKGVDYSEVETGLVQEIRPRLARRFRPMATEDLVAAGVFLSARKPVG